MNTEHTSPAAAAAPEQLSLLATPEVPLQFRLDERTRRSGLNHVAQLRAQMAAQAAQRSTARPAIAAGLGRQPRTHDLAA